MNYSLALGIMLEAMFIGATFIGVMFIGALFIGAMFIRAMFIGAMFIDISRDVMRLMPFFVIDFKTVPADTVHSTQTSQHIIVVSE